MLFNLYVRNVFGIELQGQEVYWRFVPAGNRNFIFIEIGKAKVGIFVEESPFV